MHESAPKRKISWALVATQTIAAAAIVLSTHWGIDHIYGLAVSLAGLVLGIWSVVTMRVSRLSLLPELKSDAQLVTGGPYRWIRHPMYTGLLIFTGGLLFSPFAVWKCLTWLVLLMVLLAKLSIEERNLKDKFSEYEVYSRRTKRLIPFVF